MEDENEVAKKWKWMKAKTALVVGVYSIAGIYIARWMRGSTSIVTNNELAFAAGTSAVAAWGAPHVAKMVVKHNSDIEPFAEAAASAALTWPVMYWASGSTAAANMFLPIQAVSHLTGSFAVTKWKRTHSLVPENLPGLVGTCNSIAE